MELIKEKEPTQLKYPVDWEMLNLGKSSVLKARIGWQGLTTAEYLDAGDYYLITGTDFKHGYIDWDNCVYVEKLRYDQDKNIQVKEDDVLVTKDGTIGKVAFVNNVPKKTTLNSGVFVIRPVHKSYYPRYFYYVLMSEHFKEFLGKLTAGSTISHLYQKDFVHYEFPLPQTLTEQKAIATALSDVDALITSLEQTITKKKAIKQGAMQQLLTPPHKGGKRLPGFSGEWVEKTLGELAEIATGTTPPTRDLENYGSEYCFVSPADLGKGKYINETIKNLSAKGFALSRIFPTDSIMVTCIGSTIGKIGIATKTLTSNQQINAIFPNDNFISEYIYYQLSLNALKIKQMASEQAVPMINKTEFSEFVVSFPTLKEQKAIAQILSDMDAEITQLETKKEKYQAIKQGMMQELLTGKTRLI